MLAWVVLLLLSAELCYLSPVCFPGQSATDCLQQQRQQQERQPLIVARQGQLCDLCKRSNRHSWASSLSKLAASSSCRSRTDSASFHFSPSLLRLRQSRISPLVTSYTNQFRISYLFYAFMTTAMVPKGGRDYFLFSKRLSLLFVECWHLVSFHNYSRSAKLGFLLYCKAESTNWVIYRVPGFLAYPLLCLSCQQVISLSQSSCVSSVELNDGRRGKRVGEEPNHGTGRKPAPL